MPQNTPKKVKHLIIMLTLLISILTTILFTPHLKAETKIISITPSSGFVGTNVQVVANVTTPNGEFVIQFDNENRTSGNAEGNFVNVSITIPPARQGAHNITIIDLSTGERHRATFTVLTSYSLDTDAPKPLEKRQLQEGDEVKIFINITGGQASQAYGANITVQAPNNKTYTDIFNVQTSNVGSGNVTISYPGNFSDARTNITGTYRVFFNATLATTTFFIGLTNSTEYHRRQIVDIKAVYTPRENVTLTIVGKDLHHSIDLMADDNGTIHYADWRIPENATIGAYKVNITSISSITRKTPADIQNFTVPGFKIEIYTRNLAGETVSNVTLRTYDLWANKTYNDVVSNGTGFASLTLEVGEYNFTAYYKGVKVNQTSLHRIDREETFNIACQLTNLRIRVVSAQNTAITIPFVNVTLSCNFTRDLDGKNDEYVNFILTDITGTAQFRSLLPNVNHTIIALRYGKNFIQTVYKMEPRAWNDLNITCPVFPMHVTVFDGEGNPINGATVEAFDLEVGAKYINRTDRNGNAVLNCIFGKYHVKVYFDGILLNETKEPVVLFGENTTSPFYCILYNLPITVKVVDYFGQPIPNANVTLERNGVKIRSNVTGADGIATFKEIGGTLTIKVYLANQNLPEATLIMYIGEKRDYSNPILVKLGKYVILAGLLVDTGKFAMTLLILATIVLVAIIEIVRGRRFKSGKVSS
ncbi:MAG: hypothetical protein QXG76_00080 [Candidatus Bathyarchaeia archaeon]